MNLYEACVILDIWHMAKTYAQAWSMSAGDHTSVLDEFKIKAKDKFKTLAMKYHPDKGGNHDAYIKIQWAHEIIKVASVMEVIGALDIEKQILAKYYKPGAVECTVCSKWSDVVRACATASCTGFKERGSNAVSSKIKDWRKGTTSKNSSFFSRRGQDLERTTS